MPPKRPVLEEIIGRAKKVLSLQPHEIVKLKEEAEGRAAQYNEDIKRKKEEILEKFKEIQQKYRERDADKGLKEIIDFLADLPEHELTKPLRQVARISSTDQETLSQAIKDSTNLLMQKEVEKALEKAGEMPAHLQKNAAIALIAKDLLEKVSEKLIDGNPHAKLAEAYKGLHKFKKSIYTDWDTPDKAEPFDAIDSFLKAHGQDIKINIIEDLINENFRKPGFIEELFRQMEPGLIETDPLKYLKILKARLDKLAWSSPPYLEEEEQLEKVHSALVDERLHGKQVNTREVQDFSTGYASALKEMYRKYCNLFKDKKIDEQKFSERVKTLKEKARALGNLDPGYSKLSELFYTTKDELVEAMEPNIGLIKRFSRDPVSFFKFISKGGNIEKVDELKTQREYVESGALGDFTVIEKKRVNNAEKARKALLDFQKIPEAIREADKLGESDASKEEVYKMQIEKFNEVCKYCNSLKLPERFEELRDFVSHTNKVLVNRIAELEGEITKKSKA